MSSLRTTLRQRTACYVLGCALLGIGAMLALGLWSSERYHQELTQKLHWTLAQYVRKNFSPLIDPEGRVNQPTLKAIATHTMMINPSVEIYLLDRHGNIGGTAIEQSKLQMHRVELEPIRDFLSNEKLGAVYGSNPLDADKRSIFSVAAIEQGREVVGFLYIVLASSQAQSVAATVQQSHILRLALGGLAAVALLWALCLYWYLNTITKPLTLLNNRLRNYRRQQLHGQSSGYRCTDEITELGMSFELMKKRIRQQFDQLREADRLRRELITNISHDLRTPLASMQGYLETLLIKLPSASAEQQRHYLHISHRHSKQLSEMISQLFELSKLDCGKTTAQIEAFSLTELIFDVKQDYALQAQEAGISLSVDSPCHHAMVLADIGLIQRVMQNLMDNALRHTPRGGGIRIMLQSTDAQVGVVFQDTGAGLQGTETPFVFDRFYQGAAAGQQQSKASGAGLGLDIVRRILELHGSRIEIDSKPQQGTRFCFKLEAPRSAKPPLAARSKTIHRCERPEFGQLSP